MAAIELYKQDGSTAGIYYCDSCRIVYKDEEQANWCHGERLCACGKKITQGYYQKQCNDCHHVVWQAKELKKEAERFEAAKKITEDEYDGDMVFDDNYYHSVEEVIGNYLEGQEPEYVWACENVGIPKVDLEDISCNLLDNMWDDADIYDLNGVDELIKALDAFNEANKSVKVYQPDYTTAILVKPELI